MAWEESGGNDSTLANKLIHARLAYDLDPTIPKHGVEDYKTSIGLRNFAKAAYRQGNMNDAYRANRRIVELQNERTAQSLQKTFKEMPTDDARILGSMMFAEPQMVQGPVSGNVGARYNAIRRNGGITNTAERLGANSAESAPDWLANLKSPNKRHYLGSINQKTAAKDLNTVIAPSVDVAGDVAGIRSGQGTVQGNTISINGRTYGYHDGVLYPMSGDGFYTLDRGAFKAIGVYNQFGNVARAETILDNMGVDAATRQQALNVWALRK